MFPTDFPTLDLTVYMLVAVRVTAALFAAPILGSRTVPVQVRIGIGLLITIVLAPVVPASAVPVEAGLYVFSVLREVVLGLLLGFGIHFIFFAIDEIGRASWSGRV